MNTRSKKAFLEKYGPWAMVTGASSGIGEQFAIDLAAMGFNLVITGRNGRKLDELAAYCDNSMNVQVMAEVADLVRPEDRQGLIESTRNIPIGLVVLAAGFGTSGFFESSVLDREKEQIQVNILALMEQTREFSTRFKNQGGGGIILMSSIVAFQGVPKAANYAATKAYVQTLAEGLYHELRPNNVDVLAAAPGPVKSGFGEIAGMNMSNALLPDQVAMPVLRALGRQSTVFPGSLTKLLIFGLRTVPRWGKVRIMKKVMAGMVNKKPGSL